MKGSIISTEGLSEAGRANLPPAWRSEGQEGQEGQTLRIRCVRARR